MSIFLLTALLLCFASIILNSMQIIKGFRNDRQGAIVLAHAVAISMIILNYIKTPH